MQGVSLPHMKRIRAAGADYLYFVTGRIKANGRPVLLRLPAFDDPEFRAVYGAHVRRLEDERRDPGPLTLARLARLYEASPKFRSLADGTQRLYLIYLQRLQAGLGEQAPAALIARRDVLAVADAMKTGAANNFVKTVSALYVWARKHEIVDINPCRDIEPNDVGEHEPWPADLLEAALNTSDGDVRLAVHLLLYTGQRIGDVCALRWSDLVGDAICMTQRKTGRVLHIRVHGALGSELQKHDRSTETILALRGRALKPATLRARLKAFVAAHGHRAVPHGLRKNAVNALLEAGCSVAEVSAISGQSLAMIEHYAKRRAQAALGSSAILKWEAAEQQRANRVASLPPHGEMR